MTKKELQQAISLAQFNTSNAYTVSNTEAIRLLAKWGLDTVTFLTIVGMSLNKLNSMTTEEKIQMVAKYISGELEFL